MINETTDQTFDTDIINKKGIVLVDFWAQWCMPCKQMFPIIHQLSEDFKDKIEFFTADIEACESLVERFEIKSVPSLLLFKNGILIATKLGKHPREVITTWIQNHI